MYEDRDTTHPAECPECGGSGYGPDGGQCDECGGWGEVEVADN